MSSLKLTFYHLWQKINLSKSAIKLVFSLHVVLRFNFILSVLLVNDIKAKSCCQTDGVNHRLQRAAKRKYQRLKENSKADIRFIMMLYTKKTKQNMGVVFALKMLNVLFGG